MPESGKDDMECNSKTENKYFFLILFLKKTFSIKEGIAREVREADFENASEVGEDWTVGTGTKAVWQELKCPGTPEVSVLPSYLQAGPYSLAHSPETEVTHFLLNT